MKMIQITDLHMSDRTDTPAADALRWAIDAANHIAPDLVAFTGDMTTYGTVGAAQQFLAAAEGLSIPWVFTPGNAELRADGGMKVLRDCAKRRSFEAEDVFFLLPDTSTGRYTADDREWMESLAQSDRPYVILTHYPTDTLDSDSREWVTSWLSGRRVELYLAGHRHFTRSRSVGKCEEVITRGLDPDKAFGGPPGISVFERGGDGRWTEEAVAWPHGNDLSPAALSLAPVGWSIHGDPAETVRETIDFGIQVLELRPRALDYDLAETLTGLARLRDDRPIYLSWHLPNLAWDEEARVVSGQEEVARQIDHARQCGVDAFTVHVPQARADRLYVGDEPSDIWASFLSKFDDLFRDAVTAGVRVSIENVHNDPGTPVDQAERKFATEIGEYLAWIDAVRKALGSESHVGAHFDVGHARNNGDLGNRQPLGDWYARVGSRITGYHIHQVRPHEETGKLTNHRDIKALYDRTISYAGFLHAWSKRLINRAPLFVEVRDAEERRRTAELLRGVFTSGQAPSE
jgi:sugar phosphate isomerase/epimerase